MESSQKHKKIGIIVGLERERKLVPKCSNIFVEKGYGKKAYNASKKVLKKKSGCFNKLWFSKIN